jgi:hypothetical protein
LRTSAREHCEQDDEADENRGENIEHVSDSADVQDHRYTITFVQRNRMGVRSRAFNPGLAFVLKGQPQSRSVLGHFAVLDFQIHFHNLGNAQITQRTCGGLHQFFLASSQDCPLVPITCVTL